MTLERNRIEAAYAALRERADKGEWNAWVDLFSEDCSFLNPVLPQPIKGRDKLRAWAAGWPKVANRPEWVVIERNRLVCGWTERQEGMPATAPSYRGISRFVFDADGAVREYEGIFDTAAVFTAMGRRTD